MSDMDIEGHPGPALQDLRFPAIVLNDAHLKPEALKKSNVGSEGYRETAF